MLYVTTFWVMVSCVISPRRCGTHTKATVQKPLFRVNAGMPIEEALEHASTLLFYSKKLAMEAAMDVRGEQYAWAAHYLCEMGKAVVDDLTQAMTPSS